MDAAAIFAGDVGGTSASGEATVSSVNEPIHRASGAALTTTVPNEIEAECAVVMEDSSPPPPDR